MAADLENEAYDVIFNAVPKLARHLKFGSAGVSLVFGWLLAAVGFEKEPWIVKVMFALIFALILWVLCVIAIKAILSRVRLVSADEWTTWDRVQEFNLMQVAMLWDGRRLTSNDRLSEVGYATFLWLKEQVRLGALRTVNPPDSEKGPSKDTRVTRAALLQFAESVGMRPKLLFPNQR